MRPKDSITNTGDKLAILFEGDATMGRDCESVRYLNALMLRRSSIECGLDSAARSALNIISDIRESSMSDFDLEFLTDLIGAISVEGHGALLLEIQLCAPECPLCAALAKRLRTRSARDAETHRNRQPTTVLA